MKQEEKEDLQHVQLPNDMEKVDISPKDQLIYLAIRSFMNKDTMEAFPSMISIAKRCGASAPTIKKSINNLVKKGYIETRLRGRGTVYKFNDLKKFEPFSYEFLQNEDISFTTKSYIAATQQHMFKDIDGYGKISYNNDELSKVISMPKRVIQRCNQELEEKGILARLDGNVKVYDMGKLFQDIIWVLKSHDEQIKENTEDISKIKKEVKEQQKLIEDQQKLINKLLQGKLQNNYDMHNIAI